MKKAVRAQLFKTNDVRLRDVDFPNILYIKPATFLFKNVRSFCTAVQKLLTIFQQKVILSTV